MTTLQTTTDSLQEQVLSLAEEAVSDSGLFIVDVVVRGRTGSRVVEVYVDSDEGAGLDAIAEVSRRLSFLLDTEDPIKGKYSLNVSSPGVDRSLVLKRQFPKHVGMKLRVTHMLEGEEHTSVGVLESTNDDAIALLTQKNDKPRIIPHTSLLDARVELPW